VDESLGHSSVIDYFICDKGDDIVNYSVLDPEFNLSDHLPVVIRCKCVYSDGLPVAGATHAPKVKQLRWDHADLILYYNTRMSLLYPLYNDLVQFETVFRESNNDVLRNFIDCCYNKIVESLKYSADLHVPLHYKNYYKFWWSKELSSLKDKATKFNKMWKEAGRPRSGLIANLHYADKRKYKNMLYSERNAERHCYTNDLHNALMSKSGTKFWKCRKSKFNKGSGTSKFIDGLGKNSGNIC